jgi:hypothetical protein
MSCTEQGAVSVEERGADGNPTFSKAKLGLFVGGLQHGAGKVAVERWARR